MSRLHGGVQEFAGTAPYTRLAEARMNESRRTNNFTEAPEDCNQ
jgi:hypothetical protein